MAEDVRQLTFDEWLKKESPDEVVLPGAPPFVLPWSARRAPREVPEIVKKDAPNAS